VHSRVGATALQQWWVGIALAVLLVMPDTRVFLLATPGPLEAWIRQLEHVAVELLQPFGAVLFVPTLAGWLICRRSSIPALHKSSAVLLAMTISFLLVTLGDLGLLVVPLGDDAPERLERSLEALDKLTEPPWWMWLLLFGAAILALVLAPRFGKDGVAHRFRAVSLVDRVKTIVDTLHVAVLVGLDFGLRVTVVSVMSVSVLASTAPVLMLPAVHAAGSLDPTMGTGKVVIGSTHEGVRDSGAGPYAHLVGG